MIEIRDKKKAYVEKSVYFNSYIVFNWKHDMMGDIEWNDDWSLWVFRPLRDTFFGPEFLKSLASQMEDIQTEDEKGWE